MEMTVVLFLWSDNHPAFQILGRKKRIMAHQVGVLLSSLFLFCFWLFNLRKPFIWMENTCEVLFWVKWKMPICVVLNVGWRMAFGITTTECKSWVDQKPGFLCWVGFIQHFGQWLPHHFHCRFFFFFFLRSWYRGQYFSVLKIYWNGIAKYIHI